MIMEKRVASIERKTAETEIKLTLCLDGEGKSNINTGVGFFDHMLTLFARHGGFDLSVECKGDLEVDSHHTVEDVGICLGKAFCEALGTRRGIVRYGDIILPMDEALIMAAVDLSGRAFLDYRLPVKAKKIGNFDTELGEEFFVAFVRESGICLHLRRLAGKNAHHVLEGAFKATARALRAATAADERFPDQIPSSKGVL
jgi:imidazoleglycerol-phosphate dehydratase